MSRILDVNLHFYIAMFCYEPEIDITQLTSAAMDMEIKSSPHRKRARRAVASVSGAVKRLAGKSAIVYNNTLYLLAPCAYTTAENKKVSFRFVEGGTVHSLPWTELLTINETPVESLDDLTEGVNVMAPWYDDNSITIQHAQAVIIGKGE